MVAQNIVMDGAVFTVQGTTGGDDGATTRTPTGTATTFTVDKCSVKPSRQLEDHSAAQDQYPVNRIKKLDWEISVDTKLEKAFGISDFSEPLKTLLGTTGVIVVFTITSPGYNVTGTGIVEAFPAEMGVPSTLQFNIKPYGSALTITAAGIA